MVLIFYGTYIIWLTSEILLNRLLRLKSTDRQNADKNSLALIWVTLIAATIGAVIIASYFQLPVFSNHQLVYAGLVLIFLLVSSSG